VDECYTRALEKLRENRARLDRLAEALLEHETLDEADAYGLAGLERVEEAARGASPRRGGRLQGRLEPVATPTTCVELVRPPAR
jgi:hypothetical protein